MQYIENEGCSMERRKDKVGKDKGCSKERMKDEVWKG